MRYHYITLLSCIVFVTIGSTAVAQPEFKKRAPETQALKAEREAKLRSATVPMRALFRPRPGLVGVSTTVEFTASVVRPYTKEKSEVVGLVSAAFAVEGASTIEARIGDRWEAIGITFKDADSGLVLFDVDPKRLVSRQVLDFLPLSSVYSLGWDRRIYAAVWDREVFTVVLGSYGVRGEGPLSWYYRVSPRMQLGSPALTQWGELIGFCGLQRHDQPDRCWFLGEESFNLFSQRWLDPGKRGGGFEVKRVDVKLRTE